MIAALLLTAFASQNTETDVAAYLHAHREADQALVSGKAAEARAGFEHCLELAPKNPTVAYGLACSFAKAGERDKAIEWLTRAVEWGYADADLAMWDADFASLRDDERFKSAIEAMRKLPRPPPSPRIAHVGDARSESSPVDVAIDRACKRIAVAYSGGELVLLDASSGVELARAKAFDRDIWDIAMRGDGRLIVALTADGKLHFWNPDDAQADSTCDALTGPNEDEMWPSQVMVSFDPTGDRVLAASSKHGASLWTSAGKSIRVFEQDFGRFGTSEFAWNAVGLAWNHDGSRIAAWQKSTIHFLDGKTGAALDAHIDTPSDVVCLAFDPSGKWIATGHDDARVRLWDATELKLLRESESVEELGFMVLYVNALKFSPHGERLALTTGKGVYLQVLESATLGTVWTSEYLEGRMGEPVEPTWSPDGRRLWSAYASGAMWIEQVDVDDKFRDTQIARGRPVEVGEGNIAAFVTARGVTALDTKTGVALWTRVAHAGNGVVFQTSGGWFDASFDEVQGLQIYRDSDDENGKPLAPIATQIFDPKRVRAVKAGIALAPMKW
jgi:tetratricopeptide (TPR) repeat protein